MAVNSAKFTINGNPSEEANGDRGYTVTSAEALTFVAEALPSGANSYRYQVYDSVTGLPPFASKDAPALTFDASGTAEETTNPATAIVLTLPALTAGASWVVRCTASTPSGPQVFERMISFLTPTTQLRKTVPAESTEFEARGRSDSQNDWVEQVENGGGGAGTPGAPTTSMQYNAGGGNFGGALLQRDSNGHIVMTGTTAAIQLTRLTSAQRDAITGAADGMLVSISEDAGASDMPQTRHRGDWRRLAMALYVEATAVGTGTYTPRAESYQRYSAAGVAVTFTLPASTALNAGTLIVFKDIGASEPSAITLDPTGTDTIEGGGAGVNFSITPLADGAFEVISDGAGGWQIAAEISTGGGGGSTTLDYIEVDPGDTEAAVVNTIYSVSTTTGNNATINLPSAAANLGDLIRVQRQGGAGGGDMILNATGGDILAEWDHTNSLGTSITVADGSSYAVDLIAQADGGVNAWVIVSTSSPVTGLLGYQTGALGDGYDLSVIASSGDDVASNSTDGGDLILDAGAGNFEGAPGDIQIGVTNAGAITSGAQHTFSVNGIVVAESSAPSAVANATLLFSQDDNTVSRMYMRTSDGEVLAVASHHRYSSIGPGATIAGAPDTTYSINTTTGNDAQLNLPSAAVNLGRTIRVQRQAGVAGGDFVIDADGTDIIASGDLTASLGGTFTFGDEVGWNFDLVAQTDSGVTGWVMLNADQPATAISVAQSGASAAGGDLTISAGRSGETGNNLGGYLYLDGGQGNGSQPNGAVILGLANTAGVASAVTHQFIANAAFGETSDPAPVSNFADLYAKDDAGVTRLYMQLDGGGVRGIASVHAFATVAAGATQAVVANTTYNVDTSTGNNSVLNFPLAASNLGQTIRAQRMDGTTGGSGGQVTMNATGSDVFAVGDPSNSLGALLLFGDANHWEGTFVAQSSGGQDAWVLLGQGVGYTDIVPPAAGIDGTGLNTVIRGGQASPTGNANGGNLELRAGSGVGSGTHGIIEIGQTGNTAAITSSVQHAFIQDAVFFEQASDPADTPTAANLYAKDVDGFAKMYAKWENGDSFDLSHAGLNTGVLEGLEVTINGGGTTVDIAAGTGVIWDWTGGTPTPTLVEFAGQTNITMTDIATEFFTNLSLSSAGAIVQQGGATASATQRRSRIQLQTALHLDGVNITSISSTSQPAYDIAQSLLDYVLIAGALNTGNIFSAGGANLTLARAVGSTTQPFINRETDSQSPTTRTNVADAGVTFNRSYQDGSGGFTLEIAETDVEPDLYDDGSGTLASVTTNDWTIQRIYFFGSNDQTTVVYGQAVYNTLSDALAGMTVEEPVIDPLITSNGVLINMLISQTGETDLNNSEFRLPPGGIGSASGSGFDGDVIGPASATDDGIVRFDGTSGKIIQDNTGVTLSDSGTIAGATYDDPTITGQANQAPATPAIASGVLVCDLATNNIFVIDHDADITTWTLSNPANGQFVTFVFEQDGTGGRTIALPATITLIGGEAAIDTTAGVINVFSGFYTTDTSSNQYLLSIANDA